MNTAMKPPEDIIRLEHEWVRKLKAKDVDWIVGLFAKEGRQFPPDADEVVGTQALRKAWESMAGTEGFEVSWDPVEAHVCDSGEMAYDFGTASIRTPDGQTQSGKYVVVWKREGDEWKVAVDMFNMNSPRAAGPMEAH